MRNSTDCGALDHARVARLDGVAYTRCRIQPGRAHDGNRAVARPVASRTLARRAVRGGPRADGNRAWRCDPPRVPFPGDRHRTRPRAEHGQRVPAGQRRFHLGRHRQRRAEIRRLSLRRFRGRRRAAGGGTRRPDLGARRGCGQDAVDRHPRRRIAAPSTRRRRVRAHRHRQRRPSHQLHPVRPASRPVGLHQQPCLAARARQRPGPARAAGAWRPRRAHAAAPVEPRCRRHAVGRDHRRTAATGLDW